MYFQTADVEVTTFGEKEDDGVGVPT